MKLNKTTKAFHRYRYEQLIPSPIRNNLQKVTIHEVINSKVDENRRPLTVPSYRQKLLRVDKKNQTFSERFVIAAFSDKNSRMIRIVFKRYFKELIHIIQNDKIYFKKSYRGFRIGNHEIVKHYKNHNNWFTKLDSKLTIL